MTVIIGIAGKDGRIHIGGDKLGSSEGRKAVYNSPKVFKVGKLLIGYCGSNVVGDNLHYLLNNPDDPNSILPEEDRSFEGKNFEDMDDSELEACLDSKQFLVRKIIPIIKKVLKDADSAAMNKEIYSLEMDASALIGYSNKLYHLQSEFSLLEVADGIEAIGDGEDTARGYLQNQQKKAKGKLQSRSHEKIKEVIKDAIEITSAKVQSVSSESMILTLETDKTRLKIKHILLEREKQRLEDLKRRNRRPKKEDITEKLPLTDNIALTGKASIEPSSEKIMTPPATGESNKYDVVKITSGNGDLSSDGTSQETPQESVNP